MGSDGGDTDIGRAAGSVVGVGTGRYGGVVGSGPGNSGFEGVGEVEVQAVGGQSEALGPLDDDDAAAVEQLGQGQVLGVSVTLEAVGVDVVDQKRGSRGGRGGGRPRTQVRMSRRASIVSSAAGHWVPAFAGTTK